MKFIAMISPFKDIEKQAYWRQIMLKIFIINFYLIDFDIASELGIRLLLKPISKSLIAFLI